MSFDSVWLKRLYLNQVLAVSRIMVAWLPIGVSMGVYDICHRSDRIHCLHILDSVFVVIRSLIIYLAEYRKLISVFLDTTERFMVEWVQVLAREEAIWGPVGGPSNQPRKARAHAWQHSSNVSTRLAALQSLWKWEDDSWASQSLQGLSPSQICWRFFCRKIQCRSPLEIWN